MRGMKTKLARILCVLLMGCSSSAEPADNDGDQADAADAFAGDLGADASSSGLVGDCDALDAASCAYKPAQIYGSSGEIAREFTYTDISGAERTVRIEIRRPMGAPEPSPLIVWSHGGGAGRVNPATVGVGWGEVFTGAGFVSIAIAHEGRGATSASDLCFALDLDECDLVSCTADADCLRVVVSSEETAPCVADPTLGGGYCRVMKDLSWDRPNDLREVLDWVESEASGGMLDGVVDVNRIAYGGHSAGSGSTMMVAGAARRWRTNGEDSLLVDPRPVAFMSCSPQGPDDAGFTAASFTRERCEALATPEQLPGCLTRPHLTLTGSGDGGDGVGGNRRLSFDLAPAGDRYLGYILENAPQHTTFNYETEGCERYAQDNALGSEYPARCTQYLLWLRSAALAFFDATLRDSSDAKAYLASGNLGALSGQVFEWTAK
ncbi:MAG: hypothetical protein ACI9OJ_002740 [Myxococcota bacterium]|jgi:hypothetical protein